MKYLIAYVLEGEIRRIHEKLSADISSMFGLVNPNNRIKPHLTLKAPFDADSVADIKAILKEITAHEHPGFIHFTGFGHFGDHVIYINATADEQARRVIDRLTAKLRLLPWLGFERHDGGQALHATLCWPRSKEVRQQIMDELSRIEIDYTQPLNVLSLMEKSYDVSKKTDVWNVIGEYKLGE